MSALLKENGELLHAQAQHKKIDLIIESEEIFMVKAHRNSVNTVVRNLVSNSIKFTPEGGTITVRTHKSKKDIIVSVSDTGVGMSKEIISKLFRIDTKYSTKGTANEKGTGLGLILCKDFIEKNGGQILVESEVNKGSVFSFSLPLA
jgi:signal transduction histidine kinase